MKERVKKFVKEHELEIALTASVVTSAVALYIIAQQREMLGSYKDEMGKIGKAIVEGRTFSYREEDKTFWIDDPK